MARLQAEVAGFWDRVEVFCMSSWTATAGWWDVRNSWEAEGTAFWLRLWTWLENKQTILKDFKTQGKILTLKT
jgi:hypothetical protein